MDIKKSRWIILAFSCLVAMCIGSLYAWSAFASPMGVYLSECAGYEIASLAIVFTVANAVSPITMISGGFINDKLGPKMILLVGGVLFGAGMILSGFAKSVGMLILTYGISAGFGMGMIYGTVVSTAVKYFPDKSGLAGGVITAGYGISSIIIPPIVNALSEAYHVTFAFKIIGAVMLVIICVSAFIIKKCPADLGISVAQNKAEAPSTREYTYLEMLKTPDAYLMLITLTCGAFAGLMLISQASPIAQEMMHMSRASAAIVVSVIALFNALGRLASGAISDKIGATGTMRITFAASLVASVLLYFCTEKSMVLFYVCLAIIGFAFGSIMGIYPGFTARRFGRKNNSVNYGIMFIGFALAGLLGPTIMTGIHQSAGRYQPAFLVSAALAVVGQILIIFLRRNFKKNEG